MENNKKVLIIGESCRDIFVYCRADRLCPDVPVPVLSIVSQTENGGMAKNVHRNVQSLHQHCELITNENWHNITKTRYVHKESNHMFFRIDSDHSLIGHINLNRVIPMLRNYDVVVISDYNKGYLTEEDIETICSTHKCTFVDTKKVLGDWILDATYIKINNTEYTNSLPHITSKLMDKVIHTDGANGAYFRDNHYSVNAVEVKDVSGAGDTFLSGLVVKYLQSENIDESIRFANKCASEVVKHKGVTII